MARPKSEDKRNAILVAAIQIISEQGTGAPTAAIAKGAKVAEGSLFTYFASKDALLNALYLALKADLLQAFRPDFPRAGSLRERMLHLWQNYVGWGVTYPAKRKVMMILSASDRVTEQTRLAGMEGFKEVGVLVADCTASGALRGESSAFGAAVMTAIAETTMDFIIREPDHRDRYVMAGFNAFWNAVSLPNT